jgi:hypothetical protein
VLNTCAFQPGIAFFWLGQRHFWHFFYVSVQESEGYTFWSVS